MKSIVAFIATALLVLPIQAHERERAPKAADKEPSMKKLASFRVRGKYVVTLHQKLEQMEFIIAGRVRTPTWTLLWMDATNLETDVTRRVWSVYHPWKASEESPAEFRVPELRFKSLRAEPSAATPQPEELKTERDDACEGRANRSADAADLEESRIEKGSFVLYHQLTDFTLGARSDHVIALAYLSGLAGMKMRLVNFYEIDLTQTVEAAKIPDQPLRPGAAYVRAEAFLRSVQGRHTLHPFFVMQTTYGENKAKSLFAENQLKIKSVAWVKGHWKVVLALGEKHFTFVRNKDGATWRVEFDKGDVNGDGEQRGRS